MPAVTSGTILVTGANSFIAGWVMKTALEQGFVVRGTVRGESKATTYLRSLFHSYGDKFEIVIVEDITAVGCHLLRYYGRSSEHLLNAGRCLRRSR